MNSKNDEIFYQKVLDELRTSGRREALWLKALTSNHGDEQAAKITYIKLRVHQLQIEERERLLNSGAEDKKIGYIALAIIGGILLLIIFILTR